MQEFIEVVLPRLYGLPWVPPFSPWVSVDAAVRALEPCFTTLFYSNLYGELSLIITNLRTLKNCYLKRVVSGDKIMNLLTKYLLYDMDKNDASIPERVSWLQTNSLMVVPGCYFCHLPF